MKSVFFFCSLFLRKQIRVRLRATITHRRVGSARCDRISIFLDVITSSLFWKWLLMNLNCGLARGRAYACAQDRIDATGQQTKKLSPTTLHSTNDEITSFLFIFSRCLMVSLTIWKIAQSWKVVMFYVCVYVSWRHLANQDSSLLSFSIVHSLIGSQSVVAHQQLNKQRPTCCSNQMCARKIYRSKLITTSISYGIGSQLLTFSDRYWLLQSPFF